MIFKTRIANGVVDFYIVSDWFWVIFNPSPPIWKFQPPSREEEGGHWKRINVQIIVVGYCCSLLYYVLYMV